MTGTAESDLAVITLVCRTGSQDMRLCKQCNAGGTYDCCAGYDVCQAACEFGHAEDKKGFPIVDMCNAP